MHTYTRADFMVLSGQYLFDVICTFYGCHCYEPQSAGEPALDFGGDGGKQPKYVAQPVQCTYALECVCVSNCSVYEL